jgi:ATP-binding cassette subfamily C protein
MAASADVGAGLLEEAAIWEALELVGFADRIRAMPEGLETMLGDRGHTLSAGERQRIALARALARRPLVLVMDEATSALNPLDEAAIVARLERLKGRMTVLLIAHRASSVTRADHVAVLEDGVLTEEGSLASMLERSDSFVNRMAAAGTLTGEAAE